MKVAAIYMAAGFGKRFGGNKLMYPLCGKPLYQYGLDHLQGALAQLVQPERQEQQEQQEQPKQPERADDVSYRIIVVSQYPDIIDRCREQGLEARLNSGAAEGIAASVRLGVEAAGEVDAYAFFVADQPLLQTDTLTAFFSGYIQSHKSLGCMQACGRRGNPSVFAASFRQELLSLRGDKGGSAILQRYADEDLWLCPSAAWELMDIDTPEAAEKAATRLKALPQD